MKTNYLQRSLGLIGCGVSLVALSGCGLKSEHDDAPDASLANVGVTFSVNKGLLVPPETARVIGLQIADVAEHSITAELYFSAQVYRASSEPPSTPLPSTDQHFALASGLVSSLDAAQLHEGDTLSVVKESGNAPLSGHLVTLKRNLEKASGYVEVLIAIVDAPNPLPSGAVVAVTASLGSPKNVISVPRSALLRTTEGDFVYTLSGEHFVRASLRLGNVNSAMAEVTDGLYAGDQIVIQPVMTLWMAELQSLRRGKACADGH